MINDVNMLWVEKYRPQTIEDCILPDRLKKPFQEYVNKKEIPNMILAGTAGVGKTTVARAMCEEIGADYILINGSDESGIDVLRVKIKGFASSVSLMGGRKVIIIDEADYLNPNSTQPAFRGVIEEFSGNCSFIFTCNYKNRIIEPLHSRCAVIDFKLVNGEKAKMASAFMKRIETVLKTEAVEFDQKVLAEVIMKFFPDYRRVLNELQRYASSGKVDSGILSMNGTFRIKELITLIGQKNFAEIRKWVAANSDNDVNIIYREIYDNLYEVLKKDSIPVAVILLSKYQYQAAFCADQEINLLAFLTEMMIECEVA
ncbi:HolB ATPase involved in DNA replication [uncultured Caudovirales phage]|uniref:Sliding-clamp-loader large subunit n=1 Tax=uncultured Caudovirales phage TaxID=2100421 RepID=A0A6J5KTU8_9CAUD|nr:HolB ATPase involved in DNA replication [uncultured Caudovirales phage]